jgi:hypothetical protein
MTDSTGSPEDALIAAARERVLAAARRARRVGDQVAVRFDPRRGERDPTFDLDALGVQYTVTLLHDQQTGRAYLEARFALADVEWPLTRPRSRVVLGSPCCWSGSSRQPPATPGATCAGGCRPGCPGRRSARRWAA